MQIILKSSFLFLLIASAQSCCAQMTRSDIIKGEIITKKRIKGKVEATSSYNGFPAEITVHSGTYHKIQINIPKKELSVVISFSDMNKVLHSQRYTVNKLNNTVKDFIFNDFQRKYLVKKKGILLFKIYDTLLNKEIYQFKSSIQLGLQ